VREQAIDETNDYVVVVRREQLALRARLHERIAEIDTALAGLRVAPRETRRAVARGRVDGETSEAKRVEALVRSREVLKDDLFTLELADERGWDEIKASIERDLEVHGPHGSIGDGRADERARFRYLASPHGRSELDVLPEIGDQGPPPREHPSVRARDLR
jgi:hypothetical protein